jgi:hypothetical protein
VSWFFQNGELADSASSTGSHGALCCITAIAASRSGTSTCTWVPQICCSNASIWYSSRIRS